MSTTIGNTNALSNDPKKNFWDELEDDLPEPQKTIWDELDPITTTPKKTDVRDVERLRRRRIM